jgi:hypothetical protein
MRKSTSGCSCYGQYNIYDSHSTFFRPSFAGPEAYRDLVTKNGHSVGLWCINFYEGLNGTPCFGVPFTLMQKGRKDQDVGF